MTLKPLTPFFFGQLADEGIRTVLKGAFSHSQLTACVFDGVLWRRKPGEDCTSFEARVCADLREMLAIPKQTSSTRNPQASPFVE